MKADPQEIIRKGKIPKDGLDNFWSKFFGSLPAGLLFIAFGSSFFDKEGIAIEYKLLFFSLSAVLFIYTLWCFYKERDLKVIRTGLPKTENLKVLQQAIKQLNWRIDRRVREDYHEVDIPLVFGGTGHRMIVILDENRFHYNIRNVGTGIGRFPYLFGIDTIKEWNFNRAITRAIHDSNI